jgi:hypothetical protein
MSTVLTTPMKIAAAGGLALITFLVVKCEPTLKELPVVLLWFAVLGVAWYFAFRLSHVIADEHGIEVRRNWRRMRFPYSAITSITTGWWPTVWTHVRLTVTLPGGGTRTIRFRARPMLVGWVNGEHADVVYLKRMAMLP